MRSFISLEDTFFIAGAHGMAGSAISRSLKKNGYGNPDQGGVLLTPTRTELNLLDYNAVNKWFGYNSPSVVILAAATVGGIEANRSRPVDFLLDNIKIETNVIEAAWRHGAKRLLFLGSSCIYPKFAPQPIREEYLLTGSLEPTNEWYAIAKITGIKLAEALRNQYGFDAISLMPTNLYGPGDNYNINESHVMPAMIRRFYEAREKNQATITCWGTGSPLREFLYVDDLGDACVFALEQWNPSDKYAPKDSQGKTLSFLNVGTGSDISIKELAEIIALIVGYEGNIHWDATKPDGTPKKQLDTSLLSSMGWKAKVNLSQGIHMTIDDFLCRRRQKNLRI